MAGFILDGKPVRKFLFVRQRRLTLNQIVEVEAFNVDHAVDRLIEHYKGSERADWEFLEEIDPEGFIGKLGDALPLRPLVSVHKH